MTEPKPATPKTFLFLVESRHPDAPDIYDRNFFLVGAPKLGEVNFDFFSRASDAQKWAMLVHAFECFQSAMSRMSKATEDKFSEMEKRISALENPKRIVRAVKIPDAH